MDENNSKFNWFMLACTQMFAYAVIGATIFSIILGRFYSNPTSQDTDAVTLLSDSFFVSENVIALPSSSILQLLGLSIVICFMLLIFVSDFYLKKHMLIWRFSIFLFLALIVISLFSLVFRWFPPNSAIGWISMLGSFTIASCTSIIPTLIKIRREDAALEKAFSAYKEKSENV